MYYYVLLLLFCTACTYTADDSYYFDSAQYNNRGRETHALLCKKFDSWHSWAQKCKQLPVFYQESAENPYKTALNMQQLLTVLSTAIQQDVLLKKELNWVGKDQPGTAYSEPIKDKLSEFTPCVQKLLLNPNSRVIIAGDRHGDIHSLMSMMEKLVELGTLDPEDPFIVKDPNAYILFLGDLVDRGWYGAEVLYTILRLKLANPGNVFIARGNHEEVTMNNQPLPHGGFIRELWRKVEQEMGEDATEDDVEKKYTEIVFALSHVYNRLPVAFYVGSGTEAHKDYMLCCHGGLEIGFNPRDLLQDPAPNACQMARKLRRITEIKKHKMPVPVGREVLNTYQKSGNQAQDFIIQSPLHMGFMWNDFIAENDVDIAYLDETSGRLHFGKPVTEWDLKRQSTQENIVRGVIRAHQHGDPNIMGRALTNIEEFPDADIDEYGVAKLWRPYDPENDTYEHANEPLWDGCVLTFLVSPYTGYGPSWDFTEDAFGIMTIARTFDEWNLEMFRHEFTPPLPVGSETDSETESEDEWWHEFVEEVEIALEENEEE